MPGDMMPKPPGNRVDSPIRGHRTRPAAGKSPPRQRPYRASIECLCIYIKDERQEYRICRSDNYFVLFWGSQAPSPRPLPHGERESVIVSVQSCILINGGIKC